MKIIEKRDKDENHGNWRKLLKIRQRMKMMKHDSMSNDGKSMKLKQT